MLCVPGVIDSVQVLNVQINNISIQELLVDLRHGIVLTPNVDHLIKLQRDPDFLKIYKLADYKLCDSQILLYASHFLGTPLKERISGSDLLPRFCEFHRNSSEITLFLLGGDCAAVVEKAAMRLNQKVGRRIVVDTFAPSFGFEQNEQE